MVAKDADHGAQLAGADMSDRVGNKADTGATTGAVTGGVLGGLTGLLIGIKAKTTAHVGTAKMSIP